MNTYVRGFNGERLDPVSGSTHLGNGYRAYNPALKRFSCPDSMSPFSVGEINPYAYCAGDPLNRADPSGHVSTAGWGAGLLSGIAGVVLSVVTGGTSLAVSIAIVTTLATSVLDLAAGLIEAKDPKTASALGWGALAVGILSVGIEAAAGGYKILNKATAGLRKRLGNIQRIGLSGGAKEAGREMAAGIQDNHLNYLTYIHDDQNFTHEVNFMNNPYKIRSRRVGYENETFFTNEYRPYKWVFYANFRSENEVVYASQIIDYQFLRMKELNNFNTLPNSLVASMVMNEQVLNATAGKTSAEMLEIMRSTSVGKYVSRIFDKFNLKPVYITRENDCPGVCADFVIYFNNPQLS